MPPCSLCVHVLQEKITIVTGKGHWASNDDFTHTDVVIAYFNRQFMVMKVGECCENKFFFLIFVEMSCDKFSNFVRT